MVDRLPGTGAFNAHLSFTSARASGDREKLRNKLVDVGQRFVGFDKILEEETVKRKQTESSRVAGVQDGLLKLESAMNSEIKRRVDANKQVQLYTENLANSMLDRLQSTILQRIEKIASSLETLSLRTSALEKGISQFRGELPSKLQVDTAALVKEISQLRTQMEQEQQKRIEGDTALLRRVAEIEATESRRFDEGLEALQRECELLRNEVENFARTEDGNGARVEQFHTFILEDSRGGGSISSKFFVWVGRKRSMGGWVIPSLL